MILFKGFELLDIFEVAKNMLFLDQFYSFIVLRHNHLKIGWLLLTTAVFNQQLLIWRKKSAIRGKGAICRAGLALTFDIRSRALTVKHIR